MWQLAVELLDQVPPCKLKYPPSLLPDMKYYELQAILNNNKLMNFGYQALKLEYP